MRKLIWAALVAVAMLVASPVRARAQERFPQFDVSGFTFGTYDSSSSDVNEHVRLILQAELSKKLGARAVLTPRGPLHALTYAELKWKNPMKGVDAIVAGRTLPVFGKSWYDWRVDMVPTIYYSSIYWPNAAEDSGVTVIGHSGALRWYLGGYAGDTLFGNDTSPAGYWRGEYSLNKGLVLGASRRISAIAATGADVAWKAGRTELVGELVSSEGLTQELLRAQYRLSKRSSLALQHEWLDAGSTWTLAATVGFGQRLELKAGTVFGENQKGRIVGQLVTRW